MRIILFVKISGWVYGFWNFILIFGYTQDTSPQHKVAKFGSCIWPIRIFDVNTIKKHIMTTVVIDESTTEGKAFIELLRQMKFARVVDNMEDWWQNISLAERQSIEEGLADVEKGQTVSHEQMKEQYGQWL